VVLGSLFTAKSDLAELSGPLTAIHQLEFFGEGVEVRLNVRIRNHRAAYAVDLPSLIPERGIWQEKYPRSFGILRRNIQESTIRRPPNSMCLGFYKNSRQFPKRPT